MTRHDDDRPRPDPLAFLGDEVAALRERHLYRALRVMSSAQGPIVVDRWRAAGQPLIERLPGPDPPSTAARGRARRGPRIRRRVGRRPHDRRDDVDARGARNGARRVQGHTGRPHVPVRLHGQHRRDPDHHRRDRPDRQRRPQPRVDHRRHAPVQGAAEGLPACRHRGAQGDPRRGGRARPRGDRRALSADPRRHRRRLLDGRRHRALAGHRRGGRVGRRGCLRR